MDVELSIIITVYSETTSVIETIERLLRHDRGYIKEILLVVAPESSTESLSICQEAAKKYKQVRFLIQKNNPGQGWAYREGFQEALGSHVAIMSADLETHPEDIDCMVQQLQHKKCDAVSASRWLPEGGFEGYGHVKMMINFLFQRFFMFLFRTKVTDLTYGFKIYKAEFIKKIRFECTGHDFCFESILKMIKMGATIEEVPTRWVKRRQGYSKNSNPVVTFIKYLRIGLRVYCQPIRSWQQL